MKAQIYTEGNSTECWRDIEGYDGAYQVSNLGRVKKVFFNASGTLMELMKTPTWAASGRVYRIILHKDGLKYNHSVKDLVAREFIPNPNNFPYVRFIDDLDREDNSINNLEWGFPDNNRGYCKGIERINTAEDIRNNKKAYNEANKEHFKEWQKAYYESNKEYYKEYFETNKEHINEQHKAYYEANKEYKKEYRKAHYEANKEHYKEYYEANKEHYKEYYKEYYRLRKKTA